MTVKEKRYEIIKMLGYPIITEVVSYESGMDFHGDYDKRTIYSNKPPILRKHQESDLFKNPRTFDNYFDWGEQEDGFEYKNDFYDTSWEDLMNTVQFIENLWINSKDKGSFVSQYKPKIFISSHSISIIIEGNRIVDIATNGNKKETIFEAISQFAYKFNNNEL